jgi:GNAT superfamily N-acetyltransferase
LLQRTRSNQNTTGQVGETLAAGLEPAGLGTRAPLTTGTTSMPTDILLANALLDGYVRRLTEHDIGLLQDHLLSLDPASRRDRFAGAVSDEALCRYAEEALRSEGLVYGFLVDDEAVGVGELQPLDARFPGEMEAAFSVAPSLRRRGIGRILFRRTMLSARNRGIETVLVRCLPHNRAMQALARSHGATITPDDGDALGRLVVAEATAFSMMQELVEEGFAAPARWAETRRRWFAASMQR